MLSEHEMWYWLSNLKRGAWDQTENLMCHFGSIRGIYSAKEDELSQIIGARTASMLCGCRGEGRIRREYASLKDKGVSFITEDDEAYPGRLLTIPRRPRFLFVKGTLPVQGQMSIAIVGSRSCSAYGGEVARRLSAGLAAAGAAVVSGLAEGIDGAAHRGALGACGYTAGVLGGGIDDVYPRANWELFSQLEQRGSIISEYPPGTRAYPTHFPQRNRIISGLADAVLVVEARRKSGTLHTVDHALEQGKDVLAVPGRIDDALSETCNALIQQGAKLVTCVEDIMYEIWHKDITGKGRPDRLENEKKLIQEQAVYELTAKERIIYNVMESEPKNMDRISCETGLGIAEIADALFKLKDKGCISDDRHGGFFAVKL